MRISCFEDELVAKAKPSLTPFSKLGRELSIGWLDPANEEAQQYVIDLAQEAIECGRRRDPARLCSLPRAGNQRCRFRQDQGARPKTDRDPRFRAPVHGSRARMFPCRSTSSAWSPTGIATTSRCSGRIPFFLATECEALSPMVYPSHYRAGYQGFEVPGNHPEIVGIGTKRILEQLQSKGKTGRRCDPPLVAGGELPFARVWSSLCRRRYPSRRLRGRYRLAHVEPAQTYSVTWSAVPPKRTSRLMTP